MSQMESQASAAGPGTASLGASSATLPVRWIGLFTGSKATEDYEPVSSVGEPPSLVREVTDVCLAFHPHSEIRLFPRDRDVYLFWKAKATGEWIITRIALAPNPQGVRTALEYESLILSDASLAALNYDPFRVESLGLHERIRAQFINKVFEPFNVPVSGARPGSGGSATIPAPNLTSDLLASPENDRALRAYCGQGLTAPPPTFATWWASGDAPPAGVFDIALRPEAAKIPTLREAGEMVSQLTADLKSWLPAAPANDMVAADMARTVLANADRVAVEVAEATANINTESADVFRSRLGEASKSAGLVAADLASYGKRLGSLPGVDKLGGLADRYNAVTTDLIRVRHPNPFAAPPTTSTKSINRTTSFSVAKNDVAEPASTGSGAKTGIAAVSAVAVLGLLWLAITQFVGGDKKKTPSRNATPTAIAATPSAVSPTAAPTPNAADAALAILVEKQEDVLSLAKKQARLDATRAASRGAVSAAELDKITLSAVKIAYKETLSPSQYQKAFTGSSTPDYATLKMKLPALVPSVHEEAVVASEQAKAERERKEMQAKLAAAQATPEPTRRATPEPEPTPTLRRPKRSEEKRPSTPKPSTPKPSTPRPSTPRPTPAAGKAGETGL